ncbi:YbhB/YbcL family Raf kinase inhibitor-like protein [Nitrosopumilus sp.]|uniref:YbhB/YbcL family Raf kinase inhibitor-like protein n=1 Tax=Nitrosopumilus sp. TaxID=2024843 RepID=UPI00262FC366|nr:YbhB/YbcL family Raf kinase inhibitor-like protein [Nitrosopumilus sp.]
MSPLILETSSFENEGVIPRKFGYKEGNFSPALKFQNIPEGTKSLVLIMDDPDAMGAVGKVWVHWVVWNIHPNDEFQENSIPSHCLEGKTDFGDNGYGGPAPPDKEHTYLFKLYALSSEIDAKIDSSKNEIEELMKDKILETAILKGRFAP